MLSAAGAALTLEGMDGKFTSLVRDVDEFLMGESKVHETLSRLARRLAELDVEFAIAGGLAVGFRGHLPLTVDVDVVITRAGLERFKEDQDRSCRNVSWRSWRTFQ